jgi:hypothetical protein
MHSIKIIINYINTNMTIKLSQILQKKRLINSINRFYKKHSKRNVKNEIDWNASIDNINTNKDKAY